MGVFIILALLAIGACFIGSLGCKIDAKSKEKTNKLINSWQDDWFGKLQTACIEKGIDTPPKSILDKEEIWVAYNGSRTHSPGYLWEDGKHIIFCNV